jgi:hypothetical protein
VATYGDVGSGDDAPLGGHGTERDAMEALCAADRDIGRQIVFASLYSLSGGVEHRSGRRLGVIRQIPYPQPIVGHGT